MNKSIESLKTNNWALATTKSKLSESGKLKVRISGHQIALFKTATGIHACDNNCPHEGYPLVEGSLAESPESCLLTCNWHNWKFDLTTGDNLYGGDALRTYPVDIRGDEVWLDMTEPPYEVQYNKIIHSLHDAFDDNAYDRIAREIVRLQKIGADPMDALRNAIRWSWQRMEFGWTHAYAGMADWLTLYDENDTEPEIQLACLVESVAHIADDILREKNYPFTTEILPYESERFLTAVEDEDEDSAIALIRGALANGLSFQDLEHDLTKAALAHYNDFGHSLIYVSKAGQLIGCLGADTREPLLLSLVRSIIFATRENRIPEFRHYEVALENWQQGSNNSVDATNWWKKSIKRSLDLTVGCSHQPVEELYQALLIANANNLLNFNIDQQYKTQVTVSGNVNWLDFTHGITFANAVRKQCKQYPELWPQGLLQMACFNGRNAAFTTDDTASNQKWIPNNPEQQLTELVSGIIDHDQSEFIVSVHLIKTALAVREEVRDLEQEQAALITGALNRFLNSPLKRKQTLRTAHQSIQFVNKS